MIKIWGNKKNLISAVRTGVCSCERYAPGTEMRFSKRHRGNAYSAKNYSHSALTISTGTS